MNSIKRHEFIEQQQEIETKIKDFDKSAKEITTEIGEMEGKFKELRNKYNNLKVPSFSSYRKQIRYKLTNTLKNEEFLDGLKNQEIKNDISNLFDTLEQRKKSIIDKLKEHDTLRLSIIEQIRTVLMRLEAKTKEKRELYEGYNALKELKIEIEDLNSKNQLEVVELNLQKMLEISIHISTNKESDNVNEKALRVNEFELVDSVNVQDIKEYIDNVLKPNSVLLTKFNELNTAMRDILIIWIEAEGQKDSEANPDQKDRKKKSTQKSDAKKDQREEEKKTKKIESGTKALVEVTVNDQGEVQDVLKVQIGPFNYTKQAKEIMIENKSDPNPSSGADTSRADTSRADTSRADTSRAVANKADTSRADTSRADTSRGDTSRADTSRAVANKADTKRAVASKVEKPQAKPETSKADTSKPAAPAAAESTVEKKNPQPPSSQLPRDRSPRARGGGFSVMSGGAKHRTRKNKVRKQTLKIKKQRRNMKSLKFIKNITSKLFR